jgi:hypothetical protein
MTARRLRAPATDGGLLVEPLPGVAGALVTANASRLAGWDYDFQGRRASRLREQVRREVLELAGQFLSGHGLSGPALDLGQANASAVPLVVTGHQPELFHPGVWVKNFAASAIGASCQGRALNLIVDNDIPKAVSIRVPVSDGAALATERIAFDRWQGEIPFEDWTVADEEMFSSFGDRVRKVLGAAVWDPLLEEYWPLALRRRGDGNSLGLRLALARRELEATWGVANLELPLSTVCRTDGFLWFASHLLAQLPRYRGIHNTCLAEYRAAHHIRSRHHPVAALMRMDDWLEAPLWVWRSGDPRRRAVLARQRRNALDLRIAGEDKTLVVLPLSPEREGCCAVERLWDLAALGVRLRTRALTTTMFSRFLLGDAFIHGIGGARYDELGDEIARRFFGFDPPRFFTISLTLWLGLPCDARAPGELDSVARRLRDLDYNPERYVGEPKPAEVRSLINAKKAAIAGPVRSRRERVGRALEIRRCNQALQPAIGALRVELRDLRERLRAVVRSNRVAQNREFSLVLHSASRLRHILQGLASASSRSEWIATSDPVGTTPG